jgi:hypothetical protein
MSGGWAIDSAARLQTLADLGIGNERCAEPRSGW